METLREILPTKSNLANTRRLTLRPWIDHAGIVLRGQRYSTKRHEYLNAIIADNHPDQTYKKGAQVAISTTTLLKSLYVSDHLGKKSVYYFQDDAAVSDFSNDRCQMMIDETPYLQRRLGSINNVGLKHIGPGSIYFRGLFTKGKAKSIDCDMVVIDEVDEVRSEETMRFALDRLMHSDLNWVVMLSQPSLPGFGIDKEFSDTDQHYWHVKCEGCGYRNALELEWPNNFLPIPEKKKKQFPERATHYRGCSKCGTQLHMANGEWIPIQPSRFRRGYQLSQLFTQICDPKYPNVATRIMTEYEAHRRSQSMMARFTISILGSPFAGGMARVTDELLDFCEGDYKPAFEETGAFMGIDQGDTLHICVGAWSGRLFRFVWFETTDDWGRLDVLMSRFGVTHCVIDAQPNKNSAKAFAAKYPNRVSIQYFGGRELKTNVELHENKYEIPTVMVDRTESIDAMVDRMEMGQVQIPSRRLTDGQALRSIEDARRHFKQLVAKHDEKADGLMKRVYLRGRNIENHYAMAANNACLAAFEMGLPSAGPMVVPIFTKMGHA